MSPQYVFQVIFLNDLQINMPFAVSTQTNLTMQLLDSMYIVLMEQPNQHHQRRQVMVKLTQYMPQQQIKKLISAKMFNTATSFATMLVENKFG